MGLTIDLAPANTPEYAASPGLWEPLGRHARTAGEGIHGEQPWRLTPRDRAPCRSDSTRPPARATATPAARAAWTPIPRDPHRAPRHTAPAAAARQTPAGKGSGAREVCGPVDDHVEEQHAGDERPAAGEEPAGENGQGRRSDSGQDTEQQDDRGTPAEAKAADWTEASSTPSCVAPMPQGVSDAGGIGGHHRITPCEVNHCRQPEKPGRGPGGGSTAASTT